jgi:DNA-binding response OmpR family regulator
MDDRDKRTLTQPTNLLLVGEAESVRHVDQLLERATADVIQVNSVREARDAMTAVVFPIVLVDDALGEDALSLIGELRRRYGRHRVHLTVLVDGSTPSHLERALLAGADDSLDKATTFEALLEHIRNACSHVALNVR